ncbi:hypothetical protein DFH28DRAFT_963119 [Melampsora americana]|nr:hypothetical protein DFH28DRAFT_963119 [Melampsora americana]
MASHFVQGFVNTLEEIGKLPHPYAAIADYIEKVSLLPRRPVWAQVLSVANLIASIFMLCVAMLTCAIQIRNKRFSLYSITQDYIIRPNAAICFAIGCIGYSVMSIAEIWLEIVQEKSPQDNNAQGRAALTGIKGFFLWEGAWGFSWSSAGQFICAKWRPPWQADSSYNKIPSWVIWALNSTFILIAILAAGLPVVAFGLLEYREKHSLGLLNSAIKELRMMDRDPKVEFSLTTALLVLKPLFQLLPVLDSIIFLLRLGTMSWLCTLFVAMLAQAGLIGFSLCYQNEMGTTSSIWDTFLQMLMLRPQEKPSTSSAVDYFRESNVTVIISITILVTGSSFIPITIWQYYNTKLENITSLPYWLVLDLSSSCILSVVVNVVMFATLKQIIRISKPTSNSNSKNHTMMSSDEIRMQRSIWSVNGAQSQLPQVDLEQTSSDIDWGTTEDSSGLEVIYEK